MSREPARKWTKTNIKASLTTDATDGVYANDQANDVRSRKKDRRYVNEGSGRCHVFLVSEAEVNVERRGGRCAHAFDSRWT